MEQESSADKKRSTWVAFWLCAVALASCFCCDLREWLVYFDPWFAIWVARPVFVIGIPCLYLICLPGRAQTESADYLLSWPSLAVLVMQGVGIGLWWLMIGVAQLCRGPDWNFYWPWEEKISRLVPLNTINLSDWFWRQEGQSSEYLKEPLVREIAGIGFVFVLCAGIAVSAYLLMRRANAKRSIWRVAVFAFVLQVQLIVVFKLNLRWFFNVKYLIALPEYFWNL